LAASSSCDQSSHARAARLCSGNMRHNYTPKFFSSTSTIYVDANAFNTYNQRQRKTLALWLSTSSYPQPPGRSV
jgi:hypothetical protein